jgi:hypothetical protein
VQVADHVVDLPALELGRALEVGILERREQLVERLALVAKVGGLLEHGRVSYSPIDSDSRS